MGTYFAADKARLDPYQRAMNFGPGFISLTPNPIADRIDYNWARKMSNFIRRNAFAKVLDNQDYDSILRFAPETRRCNNCDHWEMNHTEYLRDNVNDRWVANNCVKCLDNEMGPCTFRAYSA